jgi:hypothetical protein
MKLKKYLYIIIVVFIVTFLLYLLFNNSYELFSANKKICCFYVYFEKDQSYIENFDYFLKHAIVDEMDYFIIVNGECSVNIPVRSNIKVFRRPNIGYDFGAYSYAIKELKNANSNIMNYDYYFFVNTSVKGPYLRDQSKKWYQYFIELFDKPDIKVVGTTINTFKPDGIDDCQHPRSNEFNSLQKIYNKSPPYSHIQSMFFCIDNEYFKILDDIHFFDEEKLNEYSNFCYTVHMKEIGLSQHAIIRGFNLNSILKEYRGRDYRTLTENINKSETGQEVNDPYQEGTFFGRSIDPYDVIFFKNNRGIKINA